MRFPFGCNKATICSRIVLVDALVYLVTGFFSVVAAFEN